MVTTMEPSHINAKNSAKAGPPSSENEKNRGTFNNRKKNNYCTEKLSQKVPACEFSNINAIKVQRISGPHRSQSDNKLFFSVGIMTCLNFIPTAFKSRKIVSLMGSFKVSKFGASLEPPAFEFVNSPSNTIVSS